MLETSGVVFVYTFLNDKLQNIHAQLVVENHSAKPAVARALRTLAEFIRTSSCYCVHAFVYDVICIAPATVQGGQIGEHDRPKKILNALD